jgi:hypothetical protein
LHKRACPASVSQGAGLNVLENSGCRRFRRQPQDHVRCSSRPRGLRVLSPRPVVGLGWRRGLRERGWPRCPRHRLALACQHDCLVQLRHRCTHRNEPRGVGEFVVFDGAPDCRRYRGKLVVGEVNCRHGPDYAAGIIELAGPVAGACLTPKPVESSLLTISHHILELAG